MLLMTEEDLNVVLEYARDTRVPTENFKNIFKPYDMAEKEMLIQSAASALKTDGNMKTITKTR